MKINFFQSLRFRMPLLIILGIMPPAILAVIGAGQYVKTLIDDLTKTTVALEVESLEISSYSWIEMNVLALKNLSQQPAIKSLESQAQQEILKKFTDTYQDTYLAHTTGLDGINLARSDKKAPKDYSDRKYFQNAIAGKEISYQTLIGRTSQKPALCIATPIKRDNIILGVTTICSLLDKLAESVGAIRIGKTGYGFIIDNLGQVLAHPNSELFSGKTLTDFSDYPPVKNLLAGNEGYFIFTDRQGIEWVAEGNLLNNGWGVIILQHKAEAFAKQVYLQNITVIILVLALVAVGSLSWLLADTLIKPIRKLSQAASDFAAGKLDRIINIQRRDELGFLSESFNKMAQQLQDSFFAIEEHNLKLDKLLEEQQEAERHQRNAKEKLQLEVRKFKDQLAPVSTGDLTVRINVTDQEIGAVADYYNITIQNLQQIVAEVTSVTQIVTQTTNNSKGAISELSQGALQQTDEITRVLSQVERMTESIQLVAANAQEAEISIRQATETVKKGHSSLNTTVEKIVNLGESTTAAKEQVQKLGKASKRISKAVQLIHTIALQTNVLAVNASIEAARAGQEGMGFNVVAEEVQSLAAHSAKTANEIEQLVLEIQTETGKVLKVMEKSNKEILEGSQSMQEIRASLQQVTNASLEIDCLIEIVSKMATEQSCTSKEVTATMADVAAIANSTSVSASDVSSSFGELLQVAEKLQDSVGQFKIN